MAPFLPKISTHASETYMAPKARKCSSSGTQKKGLAATLPMRRTGSPGYGLQAAAAADAGQKDQNWLLEARFGPCEGSIEGKEPKWPYIDGKFANFLP